MKKKVLLLLSLIFLCSIVLLPSTTTCVEEDVYDVVLFWGQSNMVGYAGKYEWEQKEDTRIKEIIESYIIEENEEEINAFCSLTGIQKTDLVNEKNEINEEVLIKGISHVTGIREEILNNTVALNYTKVEQVEGTAFEYKYLNENNQKINEENSDGTRGYLEEINENTKELGEKLVYNNDGNLEEYNSNTHNGYYSLQQSYGTNMIPQFCARYYEKTGRKVIVVMCANGGEQIANFLPSNDIEYGEREEEKPQYIYESMVEKYSEAIKYLENKGYKIGQKLYVVSQARPGTKKQDKYEEIFAKIDNNLEEDLGITVGAIVLNGSTPEARKIEKDGTITNTGTYEVTKMVHDAQIDLIEEREDIILGSSFHWDNYVPRQEIYESSSYKTSKFVDTEGNKISYEDALRVARYSLCYDFSKATPEREKIEDVLVYYDEDNENIEHFTAAALSQTGYEVANSFSNIDKIEIVNLPSKTIYYQGETLNVGGLKIKVTYGNGTTKEITNFTYDPIQLNTAGTQTITVSYEGETTTFNVTVNQVELSSIAVKTGPSKTSYYVGDNLNTEGLVLIGTYNNGTTEEISEGFECTPSILNTVGTQTITVSYEGKTTTFTVTVKENTLNKIEVISKPSKLIYYVGDTLDISGLKIKATYANGTTEEITEGVTCTPTTLNTAGTQEIVVTYSGKTTKFNVIVENKEETDNDTEKIKQGDKLKIKLGLSCWMYKGYVNQSINSGTKYNTIKGEETLEVIEVDNNWIKVKINKVKKLSNKIKFKPESVYYIYYNPATDEYLEIEGCKEEVENIPNDELKIVDVVIVSSPSKTIYALGETLNTNGLTLKITYNNGTTENISDGFTCTPTTLNTAGTQEIVVTYSGKTTKFNVIVENKEETDDDTEKIKQGDKLKIKSGSSCWMYKGYVNQNINSGTKYNTIKGEETLEVIGVDNNWIKVKINKVKKLSNRIKFIPGNTYYIYYNSTESKIFDIIM